MVKSREKNFLGKLFKFTTGRTGNTLITRQNEN